MIVSNLENINQTSKEAINHLNKVVSDIIKINNDTHEESEDDPASLIEWNTLTRALTFWYLNNEKGRSESIWEENQTALVTVSSVESFLYIHEYLELASKLVS